MKWIFDWLREQMQERIKLYQTLDMTETAVDVAIKETERFIEYINEAEAKWESECKRADFEYRINDVLTMLEEKCLYGTASLIKAMADALGIKISEVSNGMG